MLQLRTKCNVLIVCGSKDDVRVMGMNKWWICECVLWFTPVCIFHWHALALRHVHTHKHTNTDRGGKQPLLFPLYSQYSSPTSCFYCKSYWTLCLCACVRVCVTQRERGVPLIVLNGEYKTLITITLTHTHKQTCSHIVWEGTLRQLNNSKPHSFNDHSARPSLGENAYGHY